MGAEGGRPAHAPLVRRVHGECEHVAMVCEKAERDGEYSVSRKRRRALPRLSGGKAPRLLGPSAPARGPRGAGAPARGWGRGRTPLPPTLPRDPRPE